MKTEDLKNYAAIAFIFTLVAILCIIAGIVGAYLAYKYGMAFGVVLVVFIIGAVLLIDWKGGRNDLT